MGGITSINLSRSQLDINSFSNAQIYITGTLYSPGNTQLDVIWVIQYLKKVIINGTNLGDSSYAPGVVTLLTG
jgi:hypothetical protein